MKKHFTAKKKGSLGPGEVAALALAAVLLAAVLGFTDFYRCPIRWILGFACPGCGMTHAALALLRLDAAGALAANPLIFVVLIYAGLLFWDLLGRRGRLLRSQWFWGVFCVLFLAWWFWRLYRFLNGQDAGFLEPDALLWKIASFFAQ